MSYYTERHGLRKPVEKTYDIDVEKYGLLMGCCEQFFDNLAWRYPKDCNDGRGCCGVDKFQLAEQVKYDIPDLYIDDEGLITAPKKHFNAFEAESKIDNYNQYALLDFIEYMYLNVRDIQKLDFHKYFNHYHINLMNTANIQYKFESEINLCFERAGLLYKLNSKGEVERIIPNDVTTTEIENIVLSVNEKGTKELLQEAIDLHRSHEPNAARDAVEKLWDAYERLKTFYHPKLDKKNSAGKIVTDMSNGNSTFYDLFDAEFQALTKIGNNYRIRHHEIDKIDIIDTRYYDYFFNRCLSLMALAIQYLE